MIHHGDAGDGDGGTNVKCIPISKIGEPLTIGQEPLLAIGVRGYAIECQGEVWIPLIIADREGSGDVGRFLNALPPNVAIPNVRSARLAGMLRRRGWCPTWNENGVDIWRRTVVEERT